MDGIDIWAIVGFVTSILSGIFGVIFKRLNDMDKRLREAPSRDEVKDIVDVRLESVKVLQQEIKEDTKELKHKLDRVIEKISS